MVVRMRSTKSHTANRRSHHALKGGGFFKCENCKGLKKGHTVCASCGFYRGKKILDLVKKTEKKQKKEKAKKGRSKKLITDNRNLTLWQTGTFPDQ